MNALELVSLRKGYGTLTAVDNLDLLVPEGTIYGFLGPNGAGKTTTLRMIVGLVRPTSGEIRIAGKPVSFGHATGRESIGYLPDVPNYHPWMSAEEYLAYTGRLYGIPHKELMLRISETLGLVGLIKPKRRLGGYSRGMKQRLGIAQALLHKPKLLLLDEPASALDPLGRKDVMDIIRALSGKTTVFFSTHILTDIERVCDRVAILHQGKLVAEDDLASLKNRYAMNEWHIRVENEAQLARMKTALEQEAWASKLRPGEDRDLFVTARHEGIGGYRLPKIASELDLALLLLEPVTPSLEDIFLSAVQPADTRKEGL